MLQLLEKMLIFAPSVEKNWRHRGELLNFDPLENLQNSSVRVRSLKAASPAVAFILLSPPMESANVNTCRCELISFLRTQVLQNLLAKECKKAHTHCVCGKYGRS